MLKLGILDFGIIPKGHQARQILDHRIDFVPRLDKLGFSRYWLREHHKEDVAWRSPVPLITLLLGMTENMKIGSAGLIAQFHSMKRIAQDFKLLEYFFHERIDLGIANGFGISNIQLQEFVNTGGNVNKDYFSKEFYIEKIGELLDILRADSNTAVGMPLSSFGFFPAIWVLGNNAETLATTYQHKLKNCYSLIHMKEPDIQKLALHYNLKRKELEDKYQVLPELNIAIAGICLSFTAPP